MSSVGDGLKELDDMMREAGIDEIKERLALYSCIGGCLSFIQVLAKNQKQQDVLEQSTVILERIMQKLDGLVANLPAEEQAKLMTMMGHNVVVPKEGEPN